MLKIAAVAISASFTALLLKKTNPEFAMLAIIAAGLAILTCFVSSIGTVIECIGSLKILYKLNMDFEPVFKAVGVSCITQIGANFCRDCEHSALAAKVELAGNAMIIIISLPLVKDIFDLISAAL